MGKMDPLRNDPAGSNCLGKMDPPGSNCLGKIDPRIEMPRQNGPPGSNCLGKMDSPLAIWISLQIYIIIDYPV